MLEDDQGRKTSRASAIVTMHLNKVCCFWTRFQNLVSPWHLVAVLASFAFPDHFVPRMLDDARDIRPHGYLHIVIDRQDRILRILENIQILFRTIFDNVSQDLFLSTGYVLFIIVRECIWQTNILTIVMQGSSVLQRYMHNPDV